MTPNTFEAYALRGTLSGVRYFAGYVAAIEGRDDKVLDLASRREARADAAS